MPGPLFNAPEMLGAGCGPCPEPRGRRIPRISVVDHSSGRLIFALDATASRQPSWDVACHTQGAMFEAVASLGGLDVQLVFYRGFSECRSSRWVNSAADLHPLMRSVSCVGGNT